MFNNSEIETREAIERVRENNPEVHFPDVFVQNVFYGTNDTTFWPNKLAVIGRWHGEEAPYAVVSNEYKLLTHEECIDSIHQHVIPHMPEIGEPTLKVKFAGSGARLFAHFDFKEATGFAVNGDDYYPRLTVRNSYDAELKYSIAWDIVRQICTNGAVITKRRGLHTSMRHRMSLDEMELIESIKEDLSSVSEYCGWWKQWKDKQLSGDEFKVLWEDLPFGPVRIEDAEAKRVSNRDKILALPIIGSGHTLNEYLETGRIPVYEVHNAVSQFITHNIKSADVQYDKMVEAEAAFVRRLAA